MWALGAMHYERAIQGLNELFQYHQRGPLAAAAFDALAHIGHPSSLPQFVAQLNGRNATFKLMAIEGLARIGDRSRAESVINCGQQRTQRRGSSWLVTSRTCMLADGNVDAIVEALGRSKLREQALVYIQEIAAGQPPVFARHLQDPDARDSRRYRGRAWLVGRCQGAVARRAASQGSRRGSRQGRGTRDRASSRRHDIIGIGSRLEPCDSRAAPMKLPRAFYDRPTLDVARDLLGKVLVHRRRGVDDQRRHRRSRGLHRRIRSGLSRRAGPTRRNAPLYGPPGFAYVYLNYGIHYSGERRDRSASDSPAAVLIRALDPIDGIDVMRRRRGRAAKGTPRDRTVGADGAHDLCRGPGNVTMAMGITLAQNQRDLVGDQLFIEDRRLDVGGSRVEPRIGIRVGTDRPWRAYIQDSPAVSGTTKSPRTEVTKDAEESV